MRHRIAEFRAAQADPALYIELDPDQVRAGKAIAITDPATIDLLLNPLRDASYFLPDGPRRLEKCYLEVHRRSGRVDEYEVFLDNRGEKLDHIASSNGRGTGLPTVVRSRHRV